jgi:hypothetical protein
MIGFEVLAVVVFFALVDFFVVLVDFDDFDVLGVVITRPTLCPPNGLLDLGTVLLPVDFLGGVGFLIGLPPNGMLDLGTVLLPVDFLVVFFSATMPPHFRWS